MKKLKGQNSQGTCSKLTNWHVLEWILEFIYLFFWVLEFNKSLKFNQSSAILMISRISVGRILFWGRAYQITHRRFFEFKKISPKVESAYLRQIKVEISHRSAVRALDSCMFALFIPTSWGKSPQKNSKSSLRPYLETIENFWSCGGQT